jgi:hypothetical protein
MFGSGTNLMHPRPILEAFEDFELPADLVEEQGLPQLSERDRRNILGENVLRLHGLHAEQVHAEIAGDEFERARAGGYAPPWNLLRSDRTGAAV